MAFPIACPAGLVVVALMGAERDPDLVRCTSTVRQGEATIQIVQTRRVRDHAKPSPHVCSAEVNVRGPEGELRRVYRDIDAVGDRYGVAILPDVLGGYRAVAKLGDYDGRLLLVSKVGHVVDLPGPAHFIANDRFLVVEHHSDVYAVTVYDISGNLVRFAADESALAGLLGLPAVGDPPRWVELDGTVYLWPPPPQGREGPALRLDKKTGGLVPTTLSAEDASRTRPVRSRGLEGWQDCSCGPAKSCVTSAQATDAYRELERAFPGSTTIEGDACNRIEFCPDNTCEAFESRKVEPERLMEFAYLYVYAFSDYHVLAKWRAERMAREVASGLLAEPRYRGCRAASVQEAARCALRRLGGEGRITLFDVRYDENERSASVKSMP